MKKQYIAPISERVFPETQMTFNPGGGDKGGGIIQGASGGNGGLLPGHEICAPGRGGLKYL